MLIQVFRSKTPSILRQNDYSQHSYRFLSCKTSLQTPCSPSNSRIKPFASTCVPAPATTHAIISDRSAQIAISIFMTSMVTNKSSLDVFALRYSNCCDRSRHWRRHKVGVRFVCFWMFFTVCHHVFVWHFNCSGLTVELKKDFNVPLVIGLANYLEPQVQDFYGFQITDYFTALLHTIKKVGAGNTSTGVNCLRSLA